MDFAKLTFGERLYVARQGAGLTQARLAKILGIAQNQISVWEAGTTGPKRERLPALAAAVGATIDWLLEGKGKPPRGASVMLDNTGGVGEYYLEFWGYPVSTTPGGCFVGQPCPQPAQREMDQTTSTAVGFDYNESLVFQLAPVISSVKVFTRSSNSAVVRQTDCWKVRDSGICP